jgi:hypothetical protein
MTTGATDRIDTERDLRAYQQHRGLLREVDFQYAGSRGCFGLALVVDATTHDSWLRVGEQMFLSDAVVRWATLVDVPSGGFRVDGPPREVHWATARPTTVRCGVPLLVPGSETVRADFRLNPGAVGSLTPEASPQLFRVFVGLEWAMTTTAFHHRHGWTAHRGRLLRMLEVPKEDENEPVYLFGGDAYATIQRPRDWMPRAYVAFPASCRRDRLFDLTTRHPGWEGPAYPYGLRDTFTSALGGGLSHRARFSGVVKSIRAVTCRGVSAVWVILSGDSGERDDVWFTDRAELPRPGTRFKTGDPIGRETFQLSGASATPAERWKETVRRLGAATTDGLMRLWFDRQLVELEPGLVHAPLALASTAAAHSEPGKLVWEVSAATEYYRDDCDAFVFPTVYTKRWDDLVGGLVGEVAYDLTPSDPRFRPPRPRGGQ